MAMKNSYLVLAFATAVAIAPSASATFSDGKTRLGTDAVLHGTGNLMLLENPAPKCRR